MSDFLATNEFPGTGAAMQVDINFAGVRLDDPLHPPPYLEADDVKAIIITPATDTTVEVQVPVTLVKINDLTFTTAPTVVPLGDVLRVYRDTDIEFPIVDFVSLQVVTESDLDNQARQTLYAVMEARDQAAIAVDRAEAAGAVAVEANITSQEALAKAEQAILTADAADAKADSAVIVANDANTKSDAALAAAAAAEDHATNVEVLAQQAADDAAQAATDAAQASTDAAQAVSTANGIAGTANTALVQANAAVVTANEAKDTADAVDGKAQTALDDAAFAVTTANNAYNTAVAVDGKAQTALDNSAAAIATANAAQPGDATLTALAALVTAANKIIYSTGVDTFAQTDLTAQARLFLAAADKAAARTQLEVIGYGVDYISGLLCTRNSATSITIGVGSAVVQSGSVRVDVTTPLTLSGLSLAANTAYHVYLYNNAGVAAIELVTTVPASPYAGTARSKTGDTTRRWVCMVVTNAVTQLYDFHQPNETEFRWTDNLHSAAFTMYAASALSPGFAFGFGYFLPESATHVQVNILNAATNATATLGNGDPGWPAAYQVNAYLRGQFVTYLKLNSSRQLYAYHSNAADQNLFVYLYGYIYKR